MEDKYKDFYIMIGPAGSGKSTVVKALKREDPYLGVFCPDEYREKLCNGNRGDQSKNKLVWETLYSDLEAHFESGSDDNVLFDATMINAKKRKPLIDRIKKAGGYNIIGIVVKPDDETIHKQNENRKWKVPKHIVQSMIDNFEPPSINEGFDYIYYVRNGEITLHEF